MNLHYILAMKQFMQIIGTFFLAIHLSIYYTIKHLKKKKRFISYKNDVYSPAMFILKSEQQGLNQAGLANARAVIWPNNQIIQGYTAQFERMFRGVKTKNSNTIEGLKKEFMK